MSKCFYHQGREAVMLYGGKYYCAKCRENIDHARKRIGRDIEPKACFVEFRGGDTWEKIDGTGCAHWVAHEINKTGGSDECLLGCTLRVEDLIAGLSTRSLAHGRGSIKVGDIYVTANRGHCGRVASIDGSGEPGGRLKVMIRHDSSNSSGTGHGVMESDFDDHFHGKGEFKW